MSVHKPLLIKGISIPSDRFNIPKRFIRWDRLKCLEEKESICNDNRFQALEIKIQVPNTSTNTLSKDFISTAFSIVKDLQITSHNDIIKIFNSYIIKHLRPPVSQNENGNLVSTTEEQLNIFRYHYEK